MAEESLEVTVSGSLFVGPIETGAVGADDGFCHFAWVIFCERRAAAKCLEI